MRKFSWESLVLGLVFGILVIPVAYAASVNETRNSIQARMQMLNEPLPPNLVLEPAEGIREKGAKALALGLMGERGVERYNQHYYASLDYNMEAKEALVYATNFLNQGDIKNAETYLKISNDSTVKMNLEKEVAFETGHRNLEKVNEIEHKIATIGVTVAKLSLKAAAEVSMNPQLQKVIDAAALSFQFAVDTTFVGRTEATKNAMLTVLVSGFVEAFHDDLSRMITSDSRSDNLLKSLPKEKVVEFLKVELLKMGIKETGKGILEAFLNVLDKSTQQVISQKNEVMSIAIKQIPTQQINLSVESGLEEFQKLTKPFQPIAESFGQLAKKLVLDSSQVSERTSQQLLTPVNVRFTQTFDGLFTQSADSPGSLGGNHSGTLTDGTRTGAGSRPGDFTSGSFSGRTIAETGWTPATQNNAPFSGTSVGTATARGFQEGGDLKGSMTVTIPAGTQTATVSGSITISTNGSLSMPSYSGPGTVNGTGEKVGTMSGSWSQGPTQ